ncbi:ABC transporter permease [Pseudalkalibacillus salsuginis]|uniref:ABC transporter permease n=1 Tax=Pseudalkalibacillus salsuginis TaxID=2910972 RepID=UPI001F38D9A0|nr:ABC transporter permease [Pseudalkalibacillus salsuginis]MCF6408875.1 ABC transporter permease [Pseudalkalibacillus salsuginis]
MSLKTKIDLAYEEFKQRERKTKKQVFITQLFMLFTFLGLWEIASNKTLIDPLLFSSPSKILNLFYVKIMDGSLITHSVVTFGETIASFVIATILGTVVAAVLWWTPFVSKVSDPYLVVLNAMPKVALGPILIVALGPGYLSIIAMGVLISVIITTLVVYSAFHETNDNYIKVIQTFGGNKKQVFNEVVFPSAIPTIISTLKVNVGLSWVGIIVGEFLVSKQGLGYLIIYGFQVFNFTLVLLSLLVIAVMATIMYTGVGMLENLLRKRQS